MIAGQISVKSEVMMKNIKPPGADEVSRELLKLLVDKDIDMLFKLFNEICEAGLIPEDRLGIDIHYTS